ncbi:hypothetical protein PR048_004221 [Dryococelus australis]|uniref:CCHC-type domain-containing protein n=1 Tax=Dryococelus australis TaxID=614101 RepID=A0ABQ9I4V4_9NEOP|nr:hypothetical protein PR048_004221 [Dryococelus australis]
MVIGELALALLTLLITPKELVDVSYEELIQVLDSHFDPNKNEIATPPHVLFLQIASASRFVFANRKQQPTETIAEFMAELKRLSRGCNFQDLEKQLLIRIVCGVERLQHQLLSESNLTFDTAAKISAAFEAANRKVEIISAAQNKVKHVWKGNCSKLENDTKNAKRQVCTARNDAAITCFQCGMVGHKAPECRHRKTTCSRYHKVGHIKRVCCSSSGTQGTKAEKSEVHYTDSGRVQREHTHVNEGHYSTLFNINLSIDQVQAYKVSLQLNGKSHKFEVDSGAALTTDNHNMFIKLWPNVKSRPVLQPSKIRLALWGKQTRAMLLTADKSLLGRNWFEDLGISVQVIHRIEDDSNILKEYEPLFHEEGLPTLKVPPVHIKLKTDAEPKFLKARSVAIQLCMCVHKALDMLVKEGVLEPTTFSCWATPLVPVLKKMEAYTCADYSNTDNTCVQQNVFPLPIIKELLVNLGYSEVFSQLDVKQAYFQLPVHDATAEILTLSTSKGLIRVRRLSQGLSAAPSIFEDFMEQLLSGLQGVAVSRNMMKD